MREDASYRYQGCDLETMPLVLRPDSTENRSYGLEELSLISILRS